MLNANMLGAGITGFIRELLTENYDLGDIQSVEGIKVGDTNNSYFAFAKRDGVVTKWYVRQYNIAEEEQDIIFEHAFEEYYHNNVNNAMQTMLPVPTKMGKTWIVEEYDGQSNFYAVFNVLHGLEPYHWEYNDMSQNALDECAAAVAKFHAWSYGFVGPKGSGRREPSLEEQFKIWRIELPKALDKKKENDKLFYLYNRLMEKEYSFFMEMVDFVESKLAEYKDFLKTCICHKDINPGNLMFDSEDQVVAIFDLDWVNMDYRLYDIAWMGYLAMGSWNHTTWGEVPLDKNKRFVEIYNQTMAEMNCPLGKLTKEEEEFLPTMMMICAMKVIIDMSVYEDHTEEVHRMFTNVWRFMESVHFLRNSMD